MGRNCLGDLVVDGRIIKKWGMMWTGFIWLRTRTCGGIPQFLPASLLDAYAATTAQNSRRSGIIITQEGSRIDKKMVAVAWDALYDTTRKSNQ
jgi:hypothetical protein